jgi:hypothetical protein
LFFWWGWGERIIKSCLGDVDGEALVRRSAKSENWVVGSHEAATKGPSKNERFNFTSKMPTKAELTFSRLAIGRRRPTLCFLTNVVGLFSLPELMASKKKLASILYYT